MLKECILIAVSDYLKILVIFSPAFTHKLNIYLQAWLRLSLKKTMIVGEFYMTQYLGEIVSTLAL